MPDVANENNSPPDLDAPLDTESVQSTEEQQVSTETVAAPVVKTPTETVAETIDPATEAAKLLSQNSPLLAQIQTFLPVEEPAAPASTAADTADTVSEQFAFDQAVVDGVVDDPMAFAKHIATTVQERMTQNIQQQRQQVQDQQVQQVQYNQRIHDTFYNAYPALASQKQVVGAVARQLQAQYPTLQTHQLLQLTAQVVQNNGTTETTTQNLGRTTTTQLPSAGPAANLSVGQQLSEVESDIDDALSYAKAGQIDLG